MFLSFGNCLLGKYLFCSCTNIFIVAAPHWKLHLFIDQWEAELGQPGAGMARLHFRARSRSKCKNPIPGQAQKRLLSKGGPPEVTAACLHPNIIDDSLKKACEGEGCLCPPSGGLRASLLCCGASTHLRKCFQRWRVMTWCCSARSWFRKCKLRSDVQDRCQPPPQQRRSPPRAREAAAVVTAAYCDVVCCFPASAVRLKAQQHAVKFNQKPPQEVHLPEQNSVFTVSEHDGSRLLACVKAKNHHSLDELWDELI